jgi:hypothetical protein
MVLVEDDPLDAVKALNLAKKTYSKMIQNLFWLNLDRFHVHFILFWNNGKRKSSSLP